MDHYQQHDKTNKHYQNPYRKFLYMMIIMFVAMYFLMYVMIDKMGDFYFHTNNLYMTLLMVCAMILIELGFMIKMYQKKVWNLSIVILTLIVAAFSWVGIRKQMNIGDSEYLKGMIPHHSAAVLMSEEAILKDPQIIQLQKEILETQKREIEFMKRKLQELKDKKN